MSIYDKASKRVGSGGGDLFVKLQSDKKVRLRILEMPWVSTKQFRPGDELRTLFSWPVWDYDADDGKGKVRVLQKGASILNQIAAIVAEYGEEVPMDCDLVITTTGEGLSTRYNVVAGKVKDPLPEAWELDVPDMEKITKGGIPLEDFSNGKTPKAQTSDEDYNSDLPPLEAYNDNEAAGEDDQPEEVGER